MTEGRPFSSNTLLRAAIGVVAVPCALVGGIYLLGEPAGGLPFLPEMALVIAAETFFICVLVQFLLYRMKKASRLWYACAYGVPFAVGGIWLSSGPQDGSLSLVLVMAIAGAVGAVAGLAQWTIVVWRNAALQAKGDG